MGKRCGPVGLCSVWATLRPRAWACRNDEAQTVGTGWGDSDSSQPTWQGQSECVTNQPLIFQSRKLSLDDLPKAVQ